VNLEEVATTLFFREETVTALNNKYMNLLNQGMQSAEILEALNRVQALM